MKKKINDILLNFQNNKIDIGEASNELVRLKAHSKNIWTIKRLHKVITNPDPTNGVDVHIAHLWRSNNSKSIFFITGLDVSRFLNYKTNNYEWI